MSSTSPTPTNSVSPAPRNSAPPAAEISYVSQLKVGTYIVIKYHTGDELCKIIELNEIKDKNINYEDEYINTKVYYDFETNEKRKTGKRENEKNDIKQKFSMNRSCRKVICFHKYDDDDDDEYREITLYDADYNNYNIKNIYLYDWHILDRGTISSEAEEAIEAIEARLALKINELAPQYVNQLAVNMYIVIYYIIDDNYLKRFLGKITKVGNIKMIKETYEPGDKEDDIYIEEANNTAIKANNPITNNYYESNPTRFDSYPFYRGITIEFSDGEINEMDLYDAEFDINVASGWYIIGKYKSYKDAKSRAKAVEEAVEAVEANKIAKAVAKRKNTKATVTEKKNKLIIAKTKLAKAEAAAESAAEAAETAAETAAAKAAETAAETAAEAVKAAETALTSAKAKAKAAATELATTDNAKFINYAINKPLAPLYLLKSMHYLYSKLLDIPDNIATMFNRINNYRKSLLNQPNIAPNEITQDTIQEITTTIQSKAAEIKAAEIEAAEIEAAEIKAAEIKAAEITPSTPVTPKYTEDLRHLLSRCDSIHDFGFGYRGKNRTNAKMNTAQLYSALNNYDKIKYNNLYDKHKSNDDKHKSINNADLDKKLNLILKNNTVISKLSEEDIPQTNIIYYICAKDIIIKIKYDKLSEVSKNHLNKKNYIKLNNYYIHNEKNRYPGPLYLLKRLKNKNIINGWSYSENIKEAYDDSYDNLYNFLNQDKELIKLTEEFDNAIDQTAKHPHLKHLRLKIVHTIDYSKTPSKTRFNIFKLFTPNPPNITFINIFNVFALQLDSYKKTWKLKGDKFMESEFHKIKFYKDKEDIQTNVAIYVVYLINNSEFILCLGVITKYYGNYNDEIDETSYDKVDILFKDDETEFEFKLYEDQQIANYSDENIKYKFTEGSWCFYNDIKNIKENIQQILVKQMSLYEENIKSIKNNKYFKIKYEGSVYRCHINEEKSITYKNNNLILKQDPKFNDITEDIKIENINIAYITNLYTFKRENEILAQTDHIHAKTTTIIKTLREKNFLNKNEITLLNTYIKLLIYIYSIKLYNTLIKDNKKIIKDNNKLITDNNKLITDIDTINADNKIINENNIKINKDIQKIEDDIRKTEGDIQKTEGDIQTIAQLINPNSKLNLNLNANAIINEIKNLTKLEKDDPYIVSLQELNLPSEASLKTPEYYTLDESITTSTHFELHPFLYGKNINDVNSWCLYNDSFERSYRREEALNYNKTVIDYIQKKLKKEYFINSSININKFFNEDNNEYTIKNENEINKNILKISFNKNKDIDKLRTLIKEIYKKNIKYIVDTTKVTDLSTNSRVCDIVKDWDSSREKCNIICLEDYCSKFPFFDSEKTDLDYIYYDIKDMNNKKDNLLALSFNNKKKAILHYNSVHYFTFKDKKEYNKYKGINEAEIDFEDEDEDEDEVKIDNFSSLITDNITNYKMIPKTVDLILDAINNKLAKNCYPYPYPEKKNKNKNIGFLLDIKRSGDAFQISRTKSLNLNLDSQTTYVFQTIDHLAFLNACIQGVPAILDEPRTFTIFNPSYESNNSGIDVKTIKKITLIKGDLLLKDNTRLTNWMFKMFKMWKSNKGGRVLREGKRKRELELELNTLVTNPNAPLISIKTQITTEINKIIKFNHIKNIVINLIVELAYEYECKYYKLYEENNPNHKILDLDPVFYDPPIFNYTSEYYRLLDEIKTYENEDIIIKECSYFVLRRFALWGMEYEIISKYLFENIKVVTSSPQVVNSSSSKEDYYYTEYEFFEVVLLWYAFFNTETNTINNMITIPETNTEEELEKLKKLEALCDIEIDNIENFKWLFLYAPYTIKNYFPDLSIEELKTYVYYQQPNDPLIYKPNDPMPMVEGGSFPKQNPPHINIKKSAFTLLDYHRKYYPTYADLYYKNSKS